MAKINRVLTIISVLVILVMVSGGVLYAAGPLPVNNGSATVDGSPGEWDVTNPPPPDGSGDFIANLHHSGQSTDNTVLGQLYMRYSCSEGGPNYLYALVLAEEGLTLADTDKEGESFIKYRATGEQTFTKAVDDTDPDNFAFVGSPETGWEAVMELPAGEYALDVHTNVNYEGGSQTAATVDLSVSLACSPTAVSFAGAGAATGSAGAALILAGFGMMAMATAVGLRRRPTR